MPFLSTRVQMTEPRHAGGREGPGLPLAPCYCTWHVASLGLQIPLRSLILQISGNHPRSR